MVVWHLLCKPDSVGALFGCRFFVFLIVYYISLWHFLQSLKDGFHPLLFLHFLSFHKSVPLSLLTNMLSYFIIK